MIRNAMWIGIAGLLLGGCALDTADDELAALGGQCVAERIQVRSLESGDFISGSSANLQRCADGVSNVTTTKGLPANTDMFVVWAIFNDSTACTNGNPVTGSPCGPADLGVDATGATVLFYDFQNTGDEGSLKLEGSVTTGDTSLCLDGLPCRDGLTNASSSEVHVVMIENDTGAFLQGAQFIP